MSRPFSLRFHLTYSSLHALLQVTCKGVQVFFGQYTMFDSDNLMRLIMDILAKKFNSKKVPGHLIFDDAFYEELKESGAAKQVKPKGE